MRIAHGNFWTSFHHYKAHGVYSPDTRTIPNYDSSNVAATMFKYDWLSEADFEGLFGDDFYIWCFTTYVKGQ